MSPPPFSIIVNCLYKAQRIGGDRIGRAGLPFINMIWCFVCLFFVAREEKSMSNGLVIYHSWQIKSWDFSNAGWGGRRIQPPRVCLQTVSVTHHHHHHHHTGLVPWKLLLASTVTFPVPVKVTTLPISSLKTSEDGRNRFAWNNHPNY